MVILDLREGHVSQLLQDRLCIRALQRELAIIGADVFQLDRFAGVMRRDPFPVFFSRACIDDQQQVVCCETINHQIVNDRALWRCQCRVLRLTVDEFTDVVRGDAIDESDSIGATNVDLTHMRDVEQSGVGSCAQVFFDRPGGILHGHIPAAEVDHASTQLPVGAVKRSLF